MPDVSEEIALLNRALNHAVSDGIITDSEADHLEQRFAAGCGTEVDR